MITWPQVVYGLIILALGFALPRLVTTSSQALINRIQKIEDAGFNVEFRVLLAERLKGIEMVLATLEKNQEDALNDIAKSIAKAIHSPHTPELDKYLEMIEMDIPFTAEESRAAIREIDRLLAEGAENRSSYATLRGILVTNMKRQARARADILTTAQSSS